jgi:hypothetical protein
MYQAPINGCFSITNSGSTTSGVSTMARTKKSLPTKIDLDHIMSFGILAQICPKHLIDGVLEKLG